MLTAVFAILLYLATLVLVGGLGLRIWQYASTPAPLKIPTTPAPTTTPGVVLRLAREVVLFESLFRSNKWTWLFGWMFHAALLLALLRHLRYGIEPVWTWVVWVQPFGKYAAFAMIAGLAGLWLRRIAVDRVRYISRPADHLLLLLLILITLSGLGMGYVAPTDIVGLKAFVLGLIYFDWQPLPADPLLLLHLALVAALMAVFPFSKLLHAPGVFFSPTRNQADDPRERRHVTAAFEASYRDG
ncbi:MAG: respiratory nitrate reductase subunit gamma [Alphaproteobacteria bacterium]|jgi:nitrate reductase gamma subunit|nr:respiratory nitrate reductase subunit gamma [Alphaproteobacteria bacterium]MDP6565527.1 respiratory nitrate reductase subunit gamma [Alphaproteobacteria bacterium]MDP6815904.1 respiratory nitrate reductase subunit gamma [Alphaproteobacteria bacterium]